MSIKFIELFAGIGGFRYGFKKSDGNKFRCVYANEFNRYASQIYEKNYGEKPDTRDIREVSAEEIPDHGLLTAGFPCQAFSIAGKRGGFEDTRGTLFFEIARIAKQKQPRFLLLENVKGLLSHDKGKTFGTILNTLDELGYDCQWQVLNSKDFGVPQNRERVFIIGHLRGTSRPEVFPIWGANTKDIIVSGVLDTETWRKRHEQIRRVHSPDGISPTIPTGTGGGVMTKIGITRGRSTEPWKEGDTAPTVRQGDKADVRAVLTPDRANKRQNGRRMKDAGEPSFTLTGQDIHGVAEGMKVRRLTPTECERLQGFPDGWTEGISDTQRYKCLGNAVTTNVITAIGNKLKEKQDGK